MNHVDSQATTQSGHTKINFGITSAPAVRGVGGVLTYNAANQQNRVVDYQIIMKKLVAIAAALGVAWASQAVQINGVIGFSGTVQMDTGDANTATRINAWHFVGSVGSPYVSIASGDFGSYLGGPATFITPWVFSTVPTLSLWSIGSGDYTFDLLTVVIVKQSGGSLVIDGTGIVNSTILGMEATPGTWHFTTQNPPTGKGPTANFSFSASGMAVPDGGSSIVLLGVGFAAVEIGRRKIWV